MNARGRLRCGPDGRRGWGPKTPEGAAPQAYVPSMVGTMRVDASADLAERVVTLKAVADETRLRVIDLLATAGPCCHCELEEALSVPANRLSFHLRTLREAGLVTTRRRGKRVDYELAPDGVAALRTAVLAIAGEAPR